MELLPIPELSDDHVALTLTCWLLHPIPERNSGNRVITRWLKDNRMLLEVVISEFDGIPGIGRNLGLTEFQNSRNRWN
jgi:hypothetical protein